jgi:hypothetical protein
LTAARGEAPEFCAACAEVLTCLDVQDGLKALRDEIEHRLARGVSRRQRARMRAKVESMARRVDAVEALCPRMATATV